MAKAQLTREDIMSMLPDHLKGRTVHIVGPEDDYDEEESNDAEIESLRGEDSIDEMVIPEKQLDKRAKLEEQRAKSSEQKGQKNLRLTKHFRQQSQFAPAYTGGTFKMLNDERHSLSMNDHHVSLFDFKYGKVVGTLAQQNEDIVSFALSPNEELLATSNKNFLIRIFKMPERQEDGQFEGEDFKKMECLKMFKTPNQLTLELTFDPSSRFLACGTSDSHIKVFDVDKGFQTHNFLGHRGIIQRLMFHPQKDSLKLISTAEDFVIRVWDLVLKQEAAVMKPRGADGMAHMTTSLVFSHDRRAFITGGRDGCIHFWDAQDKFKHITTLELAKLGCLPDEEVNAMIFAQSIDQFTKDDPCLVFGGSSGQVCVLNVKTQKIVFRANQSRDLGKHVKSTQKAGEADNSNEVIQMHFLRKSHQVLAINADQVAFTYQLEREQQKSSGCLRLVGSHCLYLDEIIDIKYVHESKEAVLCSNSESLKLVDLETGQFEVYGGHSNIIITIDKMIRGDSGFVVTGAKDSQILLWKYDFRAPKFQKLTCLALFQGHSKTISSVNFAPKNFGQFVSASQDNTIKVWDIKSLVKQEASSEVVHINQAQLTVMAHQKYINTAKYSPNDKMIATASQDKSVKLWRAKDLHLLGQLKGHKKNIWDLQFSPSDKQLVTVSGDNFIKVWDLHGIETGVEKQRCIATLQGHQDQLVKALWINMGMQIASASVDGVVKIWNMKKQQCVNTFEMHEDKIWTLDIFERIDQIETEDDEEPAFKSTIRLLTGGCDSTIKVWEDFTKEQEEEEKEAQLLKARQEQELSHLIREQDFEEAAVLSFRLNKQRDLFLIMKKILSTNEESKLDQVDSVIADFRKFEALKQVDFKQGPDHGDKSPRATMTRIIKKLLSLDKLKLVETMRNLNAKYEHAPIAQYLMEEILPSLNLEEFQEVLQKNGKPKDHLKQVLDGAIVYQEKHYQRAERLLRASYYVDYVVSQMTLEEQPQPGVGSKRKAEKPAAEEDMSLKKKKKKSKK